LASSAEPIVRGDSLYKIVDGTSWEEAEANAQELGGKIYTFFDMGKKI
tara:strand:- start:583 stop:726 length:144 start_codon:yes stop_codon:yes gene_type:complete